MITLFENGKELYKDTIFNELYIPTDVMSFTFIKITRSLAVELLKLLRKKNLCCSKASKAQKFPHNDKA